MKLEFKPNVNDILVSLEDISVGELFIYAKEDAVNPPIWMKTSEEGTCVCISSNSDSTTWQGDLSGSLVKTGNIWKVLDVTLVIHNHVVNGD
ncbi:hypothetical protein [Klebsiella phage 05F01]|nr:hypothetical protein [Klebsiella phage 05F01]